jgi:hypothetical protein
LFPCLQNCRNIPFLNWLCISTHSIWWKQINGVQWPGYSLGGTPSLPYGVAPPIKPPTHSSQAAALWTRERQPSRKIPINLSFLHVAWSLFGSSLQNNICYNINLCLLENTKEPDWGYPTGAWWISIEFSSI